jgi:copper homeostasis protein
MPRLALEVIATSVADAVAAEQGGADRLELVVDLSRGGMTPPAALVDEILARVRIPIRVMVRETEPHEIADASIADRLAAAAEAIASRPVGGLVFGAVRHGRVDVDLTARIIRAAASRPITFHRAFEALADQAAGLEDLLSLGAIDRILTSGGPGDWPARVARLGALARQGGSRIGILVGGGVSMAMLPDIAAIPGIREVHVGRVARVPESDTAPVDRRVVASLVAQLESLARRHLD